MSGNHHHSLLIALHSVLTLFRDRQVMVARHCYWCVGAMLESPSCDGRMFRQRRGCSGAGDSSIAPTQGLHTISIAKEYQPFSLGKGIAIAAVVPPST